MIDIDRFIEEKDSAIIHQARMIKDFKNTEVWKLIENTFLVMKKNFMRDRQKSMKLQSAREMTLYFSGKEDCISEIFDELDKIVANGEAILEAKERYDAT